MAVQRLGWGYILDKLPLFSQQQTLIQVSFVFFFNSNVPHVHALGMWEEARVPRLREPTQTLMPITNNY